jgi:SAM-dependent methyltransferase
MQPTPLEQQQLNVAAAPTFWHHVRFELVRRHVAARGARTVLDVGAGAGLLGEHLRSGPVRYRFAESSPSLRAALANRFGPEALDDELTIDSHTVVALLDVIEHVDDDAALLRGLSHRMAPGAGLVVTVPAMRWLFSSWDRDLGHRRRYSRRAARAVVQDAGFDVIEASYLFPELVPIAALRRFRPSDGMAAEFPALPRVIDHLGRWVGTATTWARRAWPFGTSVVVIATRPEATA